jgi:hypothetical protein
MHRTSQSRPPDGQNHPSQLSATRFAPGRELASITGSAVKQYAPRDRTAPGGGD